MSRARQNKDKAAVFRTEKRQDSKESASMAGQNESSEVNSTIYDDNNSKPTFLSEMELVSVRDWFNNLSAIARAEAMGFVDCHFLNTLHRLLTSRTLSQPPTSEAIEANPENSGKLGKRAVVLVPCTIVLVPGTTVLVPGTDVLCVWFM